MECLEVDLKVALLDNEVIAVEGRKPPAKAFTVKKGNRYLLAFKLGKIIFRAVLLLCLLCFLF